MAGGNEAFQAHGHRYGKALAEVAGRPLVEHVWDNLKGLDAGKAVFVIRKEDAQDHHLDAVLRLTAPGGVVVTSEGTTAGAACTALLAIEHIRPDAELVIANGDQVIDADLAAVVAGFRARDLDAGTIVFDSVHPRWSFVRVGPDGLVEEAAEKRPISRWATAGFYYFRRGEQFVSAAMAMIRKDAQVGGQFFVCPTFNELILRHAKIGVATVPRAAYRSLATPQNVEEYEHYLTGRGTVAHA
jgi:NDP-sugar pyrophosphorylase family protein